MTMLKDSATVPHPALVPGPAVGPLLPAGELFPASLPASLPGDHQGQQAPELTTVLDIMERIFRLV
jgi:hypothetical protein